LIARARSGKFIDRFISAIRQVQGGYAFVGMTNDVLLGARDRLGIRPLLIGRLGQVKLSQSIKTAFAPSELSLKPPHDLAFLNLSILHVQIAWSAAKVFMRSS